MTGEKANCLIAPVDVNLCMATAFDGLRGQTEHRDTSFFDLYNMAKQRVEQSYTEHITFRVCVIEQGIDVQKGSWWLMNYGKSLRYNEKFNYQVADPKISGLKSVATESASRICHCTPFLNGESTLSDTLHHSPLPHRRFLFLRVL